MKYGIAILAALLMATTALAKDRSRHTSPFAGYEAQALSDVWFEVREAAAWNDIDWRAAGLNYAPGSPEVQQLMATHWAELRRAEHFERIDWEKIVNGERGRRAKRADREEADKRAASRASSEAE